jgi:Ni,Fe-hydrogenase III small subunit/formate hydrogenlyase subunit 6/NADH:ubiquinone oxidoreductase subunit I
MLRLFTYLLGKGVATSKTICPPLDEDARGMPMLTDSPCQGSGCNACAEVCPTDAITVLGGGDNGKLSLDLGACISCGLCTENCPTGTIVENKSTRLAKARREDLVLTNDKTITPQATTDKDPIEKPAPANKKLDFPPIGRSLHARCVATGCSACDAEIGASGNPIFDIERFGVHIVASPRYADALLVTGPVGKGMQQPLVRCYEAMADPRIVVAVGTCAISGGVHKGGYAEANGVDAILPVNMYIPGCPPHPWTIVHGVLSAMGRKEAES